LKKVLSLIFLLLNCCVCFSEDIEIKISDQLSFVVDSTNYLGEICNQHYVTKGSVVNIKYILDRYSMSGGNAYSSGGGGYYDRLYLNGILEDGEKTNPENVIERTLESNDIFISIYRNSYAYGSTTETTTCCAATTIRVSREFDAKISNYNQGRCDIEPSNLKEGAYDLYFSIPENNWAFSDGIIFVKNGTFFTCRFEEETSEYIDYFAKLGSSSIDETIQQKQVNQDTELFILRDSYSLISPLITEVIYTQEIKIDGESPEIEITPKSEGVEWISKTVEIKAKDGKTGIRRIEVKKDGHTVATETEGTIKLEEEGEYTIIATDLVGNTSRKEIKIDKTSPQITVNGADAKEDKWYRTAKVKIEDKESGIAEFFINEEKVEGQEYLITETGEYEIKVKDKAGNEGRRKIKIDNRIPEYTYNIRYTTEYDNSIENYKSKFLISIDDIEDTDSGIEEILITANENGQEKESKVLLSEKGDGKVTVEKQEYNYEITDRKTDNTISFKLQIKDKVGNKNIVELGGSEGYLVPATISTSYKEVEKNKVKINFYKGKSTQKCVATKYEKIEIKRKFSLKKQNSETEYEEITGDSFSQDGSKYFHTSQKGEWEKIGMKTDPVKVVTVGEESYYIDEKIEGSGFTHKHISYDCIYSYKNPVDETILVEEENINTTRLSLSNNKVNYYLKVKGAKGDYVVLDSEKRVVEGNLETFEIPELGIVGLELKVEDIDVEPCSIEVQGKVEIERESFKLQETDTIPIGVRGGIAGSKKNAVTGNNKKQFIAEDRSMKNEWIDLGQYSLQYNIKTVFAIEFTEGYLENQESWISEKIDMCAKSPSILGGAGRLLVGEATSYNSEGISARPWQKIKMEIVPINEDIEIGDLEWDFGNGKTSENFGDYKKITKTKYEDVYYEQSPNRTGAVSNYTLKVKTKTEEEEFKINIIDTQYGTLYGNEIWRGEHIIRKEVIVPTGMILQIGDTSKSEYETDMKCLCIGKINEEEKAGIIVEEGGCLIVDEGNRRKIEFVQGILKTDNYEEATEEDKTLQNMWKGIRVKGNLEGDTLRINDAEQGLEIDSLATVTLKEGEGLFIDRCKNGILMEGKGMNVTGISIKGSTGYGIKTNGKIECENLQIDESRQGVILKEGAEFNIGKIEIANCIVGLHIVGGKLQVGSGEISNCTDYGIKIEQAGSYKYESVLMKNNERNIYLNGSIK